MTQQPIPHPAQIEHPLAELVALTQVPGIGGVTLRHLHKRFGSTTAILSAPREALTAISGIGEKTATAIHNLDVPAVSRSLFRWEQQGVQILTQSHPAYPALLRHLHDAPPVLFARGHLPQITRTIGIVGTRYPSPQSRQCAETLAQALTQAGWHIVSGMAWGIDLAAHHGALKTGTTTALLGGGVLRIPTKKKAVAARIVDQGALLSEVTPTVTPTPAALVARNRMISGMSQAVIIIEAGDDSGSLYTARFAHKQKRPYFAVENASAGNQKLLQHGAHPVPPTADSWQRIVKDIEAVLAETL